MAQTATTGNLADAQRILIAATRYTEEHNAPAMALIEPFTLKKGEKQVTVPKVAQMSMADLVDGQDIIDEEDIGMTSVDLTSAEVGAKIVITDKLLRQSQPNVFSLVGRQMGDGMARKRDTDVHALYSGLNGGTSLGAAGAAFSAGNVSGAIAYAKSNKFGLSGLYILQHPSAVFQLVNSLAITPAQAFPVNGGFSKDLLEDFFVNIRPLNGVPIFEDGNLARDASDDAIGVIAVTGAMAVLNSQTTRTERQRDASLRGTEVVMTADYGVFELDDTRGAAMTYDAADPSTSA